MPTDKDNSATRIPRFFAIVRDQLPMAAEEGVIRDVALLSDIVSALSNEGPCTAGEAKWFIQTVEHIFRALGVLDEQLLEEGIWRFVSFPASILARSLIATLSVPGQHLFPPGYWEQGAHRPNEVIEEQRELLRQLESRRVRFHPDGTPAPIRIVHVAWAFFRMDGRFLLCHREDRHRPEVGNYVLPGGRSNAMDWTGNPHDFLVYSRVPGKPLPPEVLERTLVRELEEELGLAYPEDFGFLPWRKLAPWRQVEGARNHQAYTEYLMTGYIIQLTRKGELRLYGGHAHTVWLTIGELEKQRTLDGKTTYLDALLADLGSDFAIALESIPEALADERLRGESDMIDIPATFGVPMLIGKTGKEKSLQLTMLSECAHDLLFGLAWHAKGLEFDQPSGVLLPRGWVALSEDLLKIAIDLARDCAEAGAAIVEVDSTGYARLLVAPEILFFDPSWYRFSFWPVDDDPNGAEWTFKLEAESRETPLGRTRPIQQTWSITRNIARILESVLRGDDPEVDPRIKSGDIQKTLRDQIDRPLRAFGLRKLVRSDNGIYRIEALHVLR